MPKSDHRELLKIIEGNGGSAIRDQILGLKPQVIITGGTFRYLEPLLQINKSLSGTNHIGGSGMDFYEFHEGEQHFLIMRVRHPASTIATGKAYFNRLRYIYTNREQISGQM